MGQAQGPTGTRKQLGRAGGSERHRQGRLSGTLLCAQQVRGSHPGLYQVHVHFRKVLPPWAWSPGEEDLRLWGGPQ